MSDGTALILGAAVAAGFFVAAGGGFAVGYRVAASAPNRLLRRAGRDTERSLAEATSAVDLAGRLCEAVAAAATVTERQIASLLERQRVLGEALGRLQAAVRLAPAPAETVEWRLEPADRETELPDRTAFDGNLAALLAAECAGPGRGVLLLSIDDADRLRKRIGDAGIAAVRRSVARVLCRAGREGDLACRVDDVTFAVLLPDIDPADALAQAVAVREAFRGHPFRTGAEGPELLVTASFGFTPVLHGDEPRLVLDRARAGVARSRRWGRNRLHAYEPDSGRFALVTDRAETAQRPAAVSA